MLNVFYLGDYFLKNLKPIGDFFLQPFVLPPLIDELLRLLDNAAYLGNPLAAFISGFFRAAQGVPLGFTLFGAGIMFFVILKLVRFVLSLIPLL